jgi:hypothetical protein
MAPSQRKLVSYHKLGKEGEARETSWKYNRMNGARMNTDKEPMAPPLPPFAKGGRGDFWEIFSGGKSYLCQRAKGLRKSYLFKFICPIRVHPRPINFLICTTNVQTL